VSICGTRLAAPPAHERGGRVLFLGLLLFLRLLEFFYVLFGVLFEVCPTAGAAKLNFTALIGEHFRIAHAPELLIVSDTRFQRIGLGFVRLPSVRREDAEGRANI